MDVFTDCCMCHRGVQPPGAAVVRPGSSWGRRGVLLVIWYSQYLLTTVLAACPQTINVGVQLREPFVVASNETLYRGGVSTPFSRMVENCCGDDVDVVYTDLTDSTESLLRQNYTFLLPVARNLMQTTAHSHVVRRRFIPIQQGGGTVYVSYPSPGPESNALVSVFTEGWPFLMLMLLVAFYGALLMWICDAYWNPRHFPAFCLRGVWEGIWWAIVSMTTVGYGDRIPRSFVARIIGIIVIFQGLVICTLFTAGVTNAVSNPDVPSITSLRVGVLRDSPEFQFVLSQDAVPIEYSTVFDVIASVVNGTIDGAMLERYSWRYHLTQYSATHVEINELVMYTHYDWQVYFGVMARDVDDDLWQCMATFAVDTEQLWERYMREGWTLLEAHQTGSRASYLRNVLQFDRDLVTGTLVATGFWVLICAAITIVQTIYYKKRNVSIGSLLGDCNFANQKVTESDMDMKQRSVSNLADDEAVITKTPKHFSQSLALVNTSSQNGQFGLNERPVSRGERESAFINDTMN